MLLGGQKDGPAAPTAAALTVSELWMVYNAEHVEHVAEPASVREWSKHNG
jgi:hypothetical protein